MQHVTFTLRTLTPLFLAGADQTQAELRAPTFRGLMRYWYRALVGGLVGADQSTLQQVMEAEKAVFGATDTGSAVQVQVSNVSKSPQQFKKESYSRSSFSGRDYLLWSMASSGKGDRYKPDRLYFPQNTTFRVTLSTRGNDSVKLQQAIAAFWLLTHLGSIGSRSRRCAGSVEVFPPIEGYTTDLRFDIPATVVDLKKKLEDGIRDARNFYIPTTTPISGNAAFDALSRNTSRVWILQNGNEPWLTSEAAMKDIGANLQTYRSSKPLHQRKIFGLPLKNVSNARRASPLILRVVELQGNKYVVIATLFKTISPGVAITDYALIESWINTFPGRVMVTL